MLIFWVVLDEQNGQGDEREHGIANGQGARAKRSWISPKTRRQQRGLCVDEVDALVIVGRAVDVQEVRKGPRGVVVSVVGWTVT